MHENVEISKDLQQTRLLFDSLMLTQGGGTKGGGGSGGDNNLLDIASDIISKVITHIVKSNHSKIITYITLLSVKLYPLMVSLRKKSKMALKV